MRIHFVGSRVLQYVSDVKQNIYLTQFWKAVQSSWNKNEPGLSSSLHFFLIDCNVVEKSDTYLEKEGAHSVKIKNLKIKLTQKGSKMITWLNNIIKKTYFVKRALRAFRRPQTASPSVSLTQRSTAELARPNSLPTE